MNCSVLSCFNIAALAAFQHIQVLTIVDKLLHPINMHFVSHMWCHVQLIFSFYEEENKITLQY